MTEYLHHLSLFSREARLFIGGTLFFAYTFSVFQLLLNLYFKEAGLGEGFIGSILSGTALGTLLSSGLLVFLIHRVSYRTILIFSVLGSALCYSLLVLVSSRAALLGVAVCSGASLAGIRLVAPPLFMQSSTPKERTHLFSINFAAWILAATIGSLTGGYLVKLFSNLGKAQIASLRWALLSSVGIGLCGLIPFAMIGKKRQESHSNSEVWSWKNLKKRGKIYFQVTFPVFLIGTGAGLVIPFLNLYFKDLFNQSAHMIGVYFAWLQVFMLAGILLGPVMAKKLGMVRSIVSTELASIPFMLILAFAGNLELAIAAFFVRGALMNMAQPLNSQFAMEVVQENERPLINSLMALAWTLSWVFSAGLGGKLIEVYSFKPPLVIAALLYVVAALLYWRFFANKEMKMHAPEQAAVGETA